MDIYDLREEYKKGALERENMDPNPFAQFDKWFKEALNSKLDEPNAMTVATVSAKGIPNIRVVLLKSWDERGLVFFTNYESSKAHEIAENHNVAASFLWLGLERQLKIQGRAEKISAIESLKYFMSRPSGSRLGAWVSHQSKVITSRSLLEAKFDEMKRKFSSGDIPIPSFWGGYRIVPTVFEFWQGRPSRLHDRFQYSMQPDKSWQLDRLSP